MTDGRLTHSFVAAIRQEEDPQGQITQAFALAIRQEEDPQGQIAHAFVLAIRPNAAEVADADPPYLIDLIPDDAATGILTSAHIFGTIIDDASDIEAATIHILIKEGSADWADAYTGGAFVSPYDGASSAITGSGASRSYEIEKTSLLEAGVLIQARVIAEDTAANEMDETYSFTTVEIDLLLPFNPQDPDKHAPSLAPDQDLELPPMPIIDTGGNDMYSIFSPDLEQVLALPELTPASTLFDLELSLELLLPFIANDPDKFPPSLEQNVGLPFVAPDSDLFPPELELNLTLPFIAGDPDKFAPSLAQVLYLPFFAGDPDLFDLRLFSHEPPVIGDACEATTRRLVEQFRAKKLIEKLICALADPANPIEQALVDVKGRRSLDAAQGEQLDQLAKLYQMNRDAQTDSDFAVRLRAGARMVLSRGRPHDLTDLLTMLDDGFAPSSLRLVEHYPAGLIQTGQVATQRQGERIGRVLRRSKPAGVSFVFLFEYPGIDHFVWSGDTGEGWAEETDPSGTGGIWAEGV